MRTTLELFIVLSAIFLLGFQTLHASSLPADEDFATNAAKGGQMEVELGRLAMRHGRNRAVRSFGRRMVTDHTRAGNQLKALARRKGVTLPSAMDAEGQAEMDRLSKLRGAEFDRAYMELMVSDHEKDVGEFETEASSGADADFKAFAAKTLPTLRTHLKLAQSTAAKVK
ncbi:MAG TPA: DUF4142 domain-containing protein [Pyrinomonadaceae bacterium]|nr:DUF4142 domain-containing protein [Pyrinomonadaceae bacterium]